MARDMGMLRQAYLTLLPAFNAFFTFIPALGVLTVMLWATSKVVDLARPFDVGYPPLVWLFALLGPLCALALLISMAFAWESENPPTVSVGAMAISLVGIALVAPIPRWASSVAAGSAAGAVVGTVFEVAGVAVLASAAMLMLRRRTKIADEQVHEALEAGELERIGREVRGQVMRYTASARRWAWANYGLGFLAATFSGASGVTGLDENASNGVRTTFAVLAIVGAGLMALNTALGASKAQQESQATADGLNALRLEIELRPEGPSDSPASGYLDELRKLLPPRPETSA